MSMVDFARVFDLIAYQKKKYAQSRSLNFYSGGRWQGLSTDDIQNKVDMISAWFLENGFADGDRLALVPRLGSPDWMMIDFAAQQIGMVIVPIHPTSSPEETVFILNETEAKICIAADIGLFHKIQPLVESTSVKNLFHLERSERGYFSPLLLKSISEDAKSKVRLCCDQISSDHLLAILYTSGTSGQPKGAMLTHHNVVSNIKSILPIFPLEAGVRVLSFLPFSHIFERTSCYAYMAFGANVYFSESLNRVNEDFQSVKPYFCTCVPKTLERMYDVLYERRSHMMWWKKSLVDWAMAVGERYKDDRRTGFLFGIKLFLARLLVLKRWRGALGGKMRFMAVGAAALPTKISRLFSAAGVTALSGYGMTEASPYISVNRPTLHHFGTVGLPVPGVEIRIADANEQGEGEILIKGPNVMSGYYKRPELNEAVFSNGWLRTGDVGKFIHKHFLMITDRKKDIFKTTAGIYIAPQPLESLFMSSPFIVQCMVVGFNRPFVSAILVPNFPLLKSWCENHGIHWTSPAYMIHNIKVVQKMQAEVDMLNENLEGYKRIRAFVLSDTEWTVEGGELTASFKTIRSKLLEKHSAEIEKLYS